MRNIELLSRINEKVLDKAPRQNAIYQNVRRKVASAIEEGASRGVIVSLIALAGVLNFCPRCGEWQGPGSEGRGPAVPNPKAEPPPAKLLKAIISPDTDRSGNDQPRRENKLTQGGILESTGEHKGESAKKRHDPPSSAHGRKVDTYYGGQPKPDDNPKGHDATFIRGDGEQISLYDRAKDGETVYESGVEVNLDREKGAYIWTPKKPGKE